MSNEQPKPKFMPRLDKSASFNGSKNKMQFFRLGRS